MPRIQVSQGEQTFEFDVADPDNITPDEGERIHTTFERFKETQSNQENVELAREIGGMAGGLIGGVMAVGDTMNPATIGPGAAAGQLLGRSLLGGAAGTFFGGATVDNTVQALRETGLISPLGTDRGGALDIANRASRDGLLDLAIGGTLSGGAFGLKKGGTALLGLGNELPGLRGRISTLAESFGVKLGIQDVSTSRAVQAYQDVVGRFPIISGPLRRNAERRGAEALAARESKLATFAPTFSLHRIGVNMGDAAKNLTDEWTGVISTLYDDWFELAQKKGALIPTENLKTLAESLRLERLANSPITSRPGGVRNPSGGRPGVNLSAPQQPGRIRDRSRDETLDEFVEEVSGLSSHLTPEQFHALVRSFNDFHPNVKGNQVGEIAQLRAAMDADVESMVGGQEVLEAFRSANSTYAALMEFFSEPTAKKFARVEPGVIGDATLRPSDPPEALFDLAFDAGSPTLLQQVRSRVDETTFNRATRKHINNVFERGSTSLGEGKPVLFNVDSIRQELGLVRRADGTLDRTTDAYQATRTMLGLGGNKVTPQQLDEFLGVFERAVAKGVPDVSAFMSRRAVLSGSLTSGLVGGSAALGGLVGGGSGAALGGAGSAILAATSLLAMRGLSSFISSPQGLKRATKWLDTTTESATRILLANQFLQAEGRNLLKEANGRDPSEGDLKMFLADLKTHVSRQGGPNAPSPNPLIRANQLLGGR